MTEEDKVIVDSFHLTDVIDFRSESEFQTRPDVRFPGVSYHNLPPMQDDIKKEDLKFII